MDHLQNDIFPFAPFVEAPPSTNSQHKLYIRKLFHGASVSTSTSWHDGDPWAQRAVESPVQLFQGWDHLQHLGSFTWTGCPRVDPQSGPDASSDSPSSGFISCFAAQKPLFQILTRIYSWGPFWCSWCMTETRTRICRKSTVMMWCQLNIHSERYSVYSFRKILLSSEHQDIGKDDLIVITIVCPPKPCSGRGSCPSCLPVDSPLSSTFLASGCIVYVFFQCTLLCACFSTVYCFKCIEESIV